MESQNRTALLGVIDEWMNDLVDGIFEKSQRRLVEPHLKTFKSGKTLRIITTDKGTLLKTANVNRQFLDKQIVYPAPYASDVENGNAGILVDFDVLKSWVKRKVYDNETVPESKLIGTTAAIMKNLRKRGQSPDPFLYPAILEQKEEMELS